MFVNKRRPPKQEICSLKESKDKDLTNTVMVKILSANFNDQINQEHVNAS